MSAPCLDYNENEVVRKPERDPQAFVGWLYQATGFGIIQKSETWVGPVRRDTIRRGGVPMTLLEFQGQPMVHNLPELQRSLVLGS